MEKEIINHTKNIHKSLSKKDRSKTKIKEILTEIIIIIFAVSLSIWFHNWSEQKHQQNETKEFLIDLKEDLKKDITSISDENKSLVDYLKSLEEFKKMDSTQKNNRPYAALLTDVIINNGNYEGFKSSGKIGYIENKKLKRMILQYYHQFIPETKTLEEYYNNKSMENFESAISKEFNTNYLKGIEFQMRINLVIELGKGLSDQFKESSEQAKNIISEIEKEIK